MPKHHTCWTVTAGTDHNSWWWCSFCSFQFFRYSPAPISIKHLLEHGKTNDNMVSTQRLKSALWSFFYISGFFPFSEEGDPHPACQHDHGVEVAAEGLDEPERVHRDPQWLHQQLQVREKRKYDIIISSCPTGRWWSMRADRERSRTWNNSPRPST